MVEVKREENIKEDNKEWNMDHNDRKRKRSSSPPEEFPSLPLPENEPEIDNSAVVLSWCKLFIFSMFSIYISFLMFHSDLINQQCYDAFR